MFGMALVVVRFVLAFMAGGHYSYLFFLSFSPFLFGKEIEENEQETVCIIIYHAKLNTRNLQVSPSSVHISSFHGF